MLFYMCFGQDTVYTVHVAWDLVQGLDLIYLCICSSFFHLITYSIFLLNRTSYQRIRPDISLYLFPFLSPYQSPIFLLKNISYQRVNYNFQTKRQLQQAMATNIQNIRQENLKQFTLYNLCFHTFKAHLISCLNNFHFFYSI